MLPAIEVSHLSYSYPNGLNVLKDISFTVNRGECVGLIGPNGAGKSTLLSHLNGLLPERCDRVSSVKICGDEICRGNLKKIRQKVGFVFQDPNDQIFCPTVYEDVAFGPQQQGWTGQEIRRRVNDALNQVGLVGFENRLPHQLSGGEKRRVCLAGVLAYGPEILLLDEPTSDLDPRGKRDFKNLLRRISVTKLIATHDLDLVVELCDRVFLLDQGEWIGEGSPRELLSNEELMLALGLEKPMSLRDE